MTWLSYGLGKPKLFVIIFQGYFGPFDFFDFIFCKLKQKKSMGSFIKENKVNPKKGMIFIKKENNNKKW